MDLVLWFLYFNSILELIACFFFFNEIVGWWAYIGFRRQERARGQERERGRESENGTWRSRRLLLFSFFLLLSQRSRFRGGLFTILFFVYNLVFCLQCLSLFTTLRLHFFHVTCSSTTQTRTLFATHNWPKMTTKGRHGKVQNSAHNLECTKNACSVLVFQTSQKRVKNGGLSRGSWTMWVQGVQSKYYITVECNLLLLNF